MTELLAPAGDFQSLKTAVASGADAVYLGLSAFNARIKAENFTDENIGEVVSYCHLFGVKVHVTVNISVKNDEITQVEHLIAVCKKAGVDAFIVCDLAVLDAIRRIAPEIPRHASTQFGVCNAEGAKYAERLGFTRVVLSREVTVEEIKKIRKETNLEIECFIHGALCVAFSGKCLMSSITNGGSGNRGRCLQPCRLPYTEITTGKSGYLLSTSDLCLVDKLKELTEAGVDSFKIEGRLRRPEYVCKTVKTYRKIIDNAFKYDDKDVTELKSAFNRGGFTTGYAFDDTKDIMSTKVQGNLGVFAGKVLSVQNGVCKLSGNYPFKIGEGYKILDEKGAEVGGGRIEQIEKGAIKIPLAKIGYSINITSGVDFDIPQKKLPVSTEFILDEKGNLAVKYKCGNNCIAVKSDKPFDVAANKPLSVETLSAALTKFGDVDFECEKVSGEVCGNFFAPHSVINALRRDGIALLREKIIQNYKKQYVAPKFADIILKNGKIESNLIAVELQNINQISDKLKKNADIIVYFPDVYSVTATKEFCDVADNVYLKLPVNAREKDVELFERIIDGANVTGIYADNPYAVYLAQKHNLKLFAGLGLNVFNNVQKSIYNAVFFMASAELNQNELKDFSSPFVFAYGKLPLMTLSHCVSQLLTGKSCAECAYKKPFVYSDRKDYRFDVVRNKAANCYFTLYNSKITDISPKFLNSGFNYYLNMLQCDCKTVADVAKSFKQGFALNTENGTYGHLLRGVL